MISFCLPLFMFFPVVLNKNLFFLSSYFFLDSTCLLMFCVFPLVWCLIFFSSFNFVEDTEKLMYSLSFFFLLIFLLLCFFSAETFHFLFFLESANIFVLFLIFLFSKDSDKISSISFMFFFNMAGSVPFMVFAFFL